MTGITIQIKLQVSGPGKSDKYNEFVIWWTRNRNFLGPQTFQGLEATNPHLAYVLCDWVYNCTYTKHCILGDQCGYRGF